MVAANPAGTRIVTSILEHPGPGLPLSASRKVSAKLNNGVHGFINAGAREKVGVREAVVDPVTGSYSLILEVNADIDPTGTSWLVREPGGALWTIIVPAGDPTVSVTLRSCLVADPTNPNPIQAGVSEAELVAFEEFVSGTYVPVSSTKETITYDTDGNVLTVTETATGAVTSYAYNGDGTIHTESRVLNAVTTVRTFGYDADGNVTSVS